MFLILLLFLLISNIYTEDKFTESLVISNLNNGISFHFDFEILTEQVQNDHFNLFPKSISNIISHHSLSEMHLSLSRGHWDTAKWGVQPSFVPPQSAELWAWFNPSETNIDEKWQKLSYTLSALFCLSLNKLAVTNEVVSPRWTFRPIGLVSNQSSAAGQQLGRKAVLTAEPLCTENVTPWIKLLPCKKWGGLTQLLHPGRMFASHFVAVTLDVAHVCLDSACDYIGLQLKQSVTIVMDRFINGNFYNSWSMRILLGHENSFESCPLATRSTITVQGLEIGSSSLQPASFLAPHLLCRHFDLRLSTPDQKGRISVDLSGHWPPNHRGLESSSPLKMIKFSTGRGNIRGGIKTVISSSTENSIRAVYLDTLPWYFKMHFHTLQIAVNGEKIYLPDHHVHYEPSVARTRMAHLELVLDIPPNSRLSIEYRFAKQLQHWNEYPPDANHEFSIPSSSLTFRIPDSHAARFNHSARPVSSRVVHSAREPHLVRLYSEIVLVTLPSPDFSMPFNALCLACTVLAIVVGGLHKFTTSVITLSHRDKVGLKAKLAWVRAKLTAMLSRRSSALTSITESEKQDSS